MEQKLPKKLTKYRAIIGNNYEGKFMQLPSLFDSRDAAQSALKEHFDKNPPKGMSYDIGGYVEAVDLDLGYDPFSGDFID
jgi:hypothetical protein